MVGIVSNTAALFAQRNLEVASRSSELSIGRLSSGNAIIRASDDVSGLAIGTVLKTTVSTLRTILSSTAQASSLLSIADGGLQNIGDILARQKSLAVQANSGALSDNERAFLDEEFQSLASEIDRLVDGTQFNGIKLLDGSISGSANVTTATGAATEDYSVDATTDYSNAGTFASSAEIDAIAFAGDITVTGLRTVGVIEIGGTLDGADFDVSIGGDTAVVVATTGGDLQGTLDDLVQALNADTGTNTSQFTYSAQGGNKLIITAKTAGVNSTTIAITNDTAAATIQLNGNAAGAGGANLVATALDNTPGNGSQAGVAETTSTAGNTVFNTNLQGAITNLEATFVTGSDLGDSSLTHNRVQFTATVNGESYTSDLIDLQGIVANGSGSFTNLGDTLLDNTSIVFRKNGDGTDGLTFRLTVNGDQTINNQTTADTAATLFQNALTNNNISIQQSREVASFSTGAIVGTVLEGVTDANVLLVSDGYSSTGTFGDIGAFSVNRTTDKITVTINGETYTSDLTTGDTTGFDGTYASDVITTDGTLYFLSADTTDGKQLSIDLSGVGVLNATIDISTDAGEAALEAALNAAFNVGSNESLNFQVGTVSTDKIGISLSAATTANLYKDANGTAVTLSIATAGAAGSDNGGDGTGAVLASNVLDRAINAVTGLRATVGALQSRFDFAAANVTSSIENTEAARSNFLDVDVANESTKFATAQVRLQASISVLAQANQIPQNLLKLIG